MINLFEYFSSLQKIEMALILNIDTSTEVCSVALARNGELLHLRENVAGQNHAMLLTVFINELLEEANITVGQLDGLAVSGGPGSYTGLRIGVSVAKGICYASNIPLITLSSLESMANHVRNYHVPSSLSNTEQLLFCPMIDARRMEVYTSFYDIKGELIREIQADIIDHQSYTSFLETNKVIFFGNGAAKCRESITHSNAIFLADIITSATNLIPLAEKNFKLNKFADTAYYEPFYLKDFVATTPLKNIFKGNGDQ
jgi:tRNA threonylcarbamoyladenosine biosynthesis protein TsaB